VRKVGALRWKDGEVHGEPPVVSVL
jgi:hypothetical protein